MTTHDQPIAAFLDIGTNAIRMLVVRLRASGEYHILEQRRQVVRLGEDAFTAQQLDNDAMNRAALLCRQWIKAARATGAGDIVAVATSAIRDAKNRRAFLRRLRTQVGLEVRILSGEDEARLIHRGVSRTMDLKNRQALFLDIGGGSTEVSVGNQHKPHYLAMLNLGAVRLSNQFLKPGMDQPVSPELYRRIQEYVRGRAQKVLQRLRRYRVDIVLGSSGTIMALGNIAVRRHFNRRLQCPEPVSMARLRQIIRHLCALSLAQRRQVPGLQPDRADIIIGGAAILDTLMAELDMQALTISNRSLRDGLVQEYLERRKITA
ncbi:MAG: hypothetical protein KKG09_01480 [Verrucomicrobia bacterium]|nr:hypothetical protein [Verrucomicrobiota bacterium]MCG2678978.1 hypothetical protein [Kiritimatiellia bacterium]MBU4247634.1 hypothetical protein [Verrucomicrobiota bacterium]MBU4290815.1 hypothetical protein [Verrucomicrobiota bacterium]MBU4427866.1 hypothetical protein [Verrucomicrobiota bacterium]